MKTTGQRLTEIENRLTAIESTHTNTVKSLQSQISDLEGAVQYAESEIAHARDDADKRIRAASYEASETARRVEDMELDAWIASRSR